GRRGLRGVPRRRHQRRRHQRRQPRRPRVVGRVSVLVVGGGLAGCEAAWQLAERGIDVVLRSEEHTSELQSPYDLVCRLLLAKQQTSSRALDYHDGKPLAMQPSPNMRTHFASIDYRPKWHVDASFVNTSDPMKKAPKRSHASD